MDTKLQQYNNKVEHRPGRAHQNADSLSRRPCLDLPCKHCEKQELKESISEERDASCGCEPDRAFRVHGVAEENTGNIAPFTTVEIKNAQKNDSEIGWIVEWLTRSPERPPWSWVAPAGLTTKIFWAQWKSLCQIGGVLYRNWEDATGKFL